MGALPPSSADVLQFPRRHGMQSLRPGGVLLLLSLLVVTPAALAAPATEVEMNLYTRIAAIQVCLAQAAGVEFQKAVGIAGETLTQVILGQHQGTIAQVGPKPLSLQDLRQGSINSALFGAVEVCPRQVPDDLLKRVQAVLKGETAAPAPTQAAPAPTKPAAAQPAPATAKPAVAKPAAAPAKPAAAKPEAASPQ